MTQRNEHKGKWVISCDEEMFSGPFYDSKKEAWNVALEEWEGCVWVAECDSIDPTDFVNEEAFLESICCSEEFSGEWAEGYLEKLSSAMKASLNKALTSAFADWLDANDAWPTFFNINGSYKVLGPFAE